MMAPSRPGAEILAGNNVSVRHTAALTRSEKPFEVGKKFTPKGTSAGDTARHRVWWRPARILERLGDYPYGRWKTRKFESPFQLQKKLSKPIIFPIDIYVH